MWLLCVLGSIGTLIYFLNKSINSYLNYDVVTNINVYREEAPQFPAVSFCVISEELISINESIIDCEFNSQQCNLSEFEIVDYTDTTGETCYRFNSKHNAFNQTNSVKNTTRSDSTTGLNLYIYTNESYRNGLFKLAVFIHNQSDWFTTDRAYNTEDGLMVSSGITTFSIDREFIINLSKPYNDCAKQDTNRFYSKYFQYFIRNNLNYKQKDCIDYCIEEYVKLECNCSLKCEGNNIECKNSLIDEIRNKETPIPSECLSGCPIECDSANYKISPYYVGGLTSKLVNEKNFMIKNGETLEEFKQNLVYISVYYSSLEYKKIEQIPKTELFDLVSNIGGTLGLFIGVSFLSFIEFFELIFEVILYFIRV